MDENPKIMAERLTEYVEELLEAKRLDNKLAIKGRTRMILNVLDKLREAHKSSPFPKSLIAQIQNDKERADLQLPETIHTYKNFCWACKINLDKRVDRVCKSCGWVQCPDCGACRSPRYGGCKDRVRKENFEFSLFD